ncbi:HNH endonuclease [Brevibacterium epidermidis]|uniref:HNH endonuclease n=1 Tax=Brevibacterium epidermidis TaxID=1698 RepID=UPI0035150E4A
MATSRTGTGKWKRVRAEAIKRARDNGLTRCPSCRTPLDYEWSKRPNSAEADHITPHARGGTDTLDNVQVICRLCNQTKGAGKKRKRRTGKRVEPVTKVNW